MKKVIILFPLIVGGCATGVYHPTKPAALMQADIDLCTEQARLSEAIPVATMEGVIACLKGMGYVKKGSLPARSAEREPAPGAPCAVPCLPRR